MRIRSIAATLVGSLVCYVAVACYGPVTDPGTVDAEDVGTIADVDADSRVVADAIDAIADALGVDLAVPEAEAGPLPDDVADVTCEPEGGDAGPAVYWFARKSFPGRSRADLARGRSISCLPGGGGAPAGMCIAGTIYVRDGEAAVYCGVTSSHATSATIIMPAP